MLLSTQGNSCSLVGCTLKNYWNIVIGQRYGVNSDINNRDRIINIRDCTFGLPAFNLDDQPIAANIRADTTKDIDAVSVSLINTTQIFVSGYNGSGIDHFRVYFSGQRRQALLPGTIGTGPYPQFKASPVSGLTNQVNFDTYGIMFANELPPSGLTVRSGILGLIYYSGN